MFLTGKTTALCITSLEQEWFLKTGQEEAVSRLGKDFQMSSASSELQLLTCLLVSPCLCLPSSSSDLCTPFKTLKLRYCYNCNVWWVSFTIAFYCSSFSIPLLKHAKICRVFFLLFSVELHPAVPTFLFRATSSLHHHPSIFPCSVCYFPRAANFICH